MTHRWQRRDAPLSATSCYDPSHLNYRIVMRIFRWSLLMLCLSCALIVSTGCGDNSKPKSMTEGVELSEIEAYEQAVRDMEAEDVEDMDEATE